MMIVKAVAVDGNSLDCTFFERMDAYGEREGVFYCFGLGSDGLEKNRDYSLVECFVYVMNEKGDTVDSFKCKNTPSKIVLDVEDITPEGHKVRHIKVKKGSIEDCVIYLPKGITAKMYV